jgi:hypothetical protein
MANRGRRTGRNLAPPPSSPCRGAPELGGIELRQRRSLVRPPPPQPHPPTAAAKTRRRRRPEWSLAPPPPSSHLLGPRLRDERRRGQGGSGRRGGGPPIPSTTKRAPPPPSSHPRGLPAERSSGGEGRNGEVAGRRRRLGFLPEPPREGSAGVGSWSKKDGAFGLVQVNRS